MTVLYPGGSPMVVYVVMQWDDGYQTLSLHLTEEGARAEMARVIARHVTESQHPAPQYWIDEGGTQDRWDAGCEDWIRHEYSIHRMEVQP